MLARVVTHVLVCYPMVQARVLLHVLAYVVTHVLARVVTHVLARVIMHVHDYYLKTCGLDVFMCLSITIRELFAKNLGVDDDVKP